ncbi:hypothetical protein M9Y10_044675 [Tritrichomonas musculus]|uniref:Small GTP-binding protein n=1 Tax=Tritrichomonas musculus TaxID=1915356 RepID=A0ABR2JW01_9EUKA
MDVKIVLIGNSAVGKTSVVRKATNRETAADQGPTLGASYLSMRRSYNDKVVDLQIWDTAGQEKYRSMAPMYFRGSHIAVLMYSIIDKESFNGINEWNQILTQNTNDDIIKYLVGNKIDLQDQRIVTKAEGQNKATEINASFYEVSALTGEGVMDLIEEITKSASEIPINVQSASIAVEEEEKPKSKKGCC